MPPTDSLSASTVAILGLGLMGGSLALALRGRCASMLGVDPDAETCQAALERQVVDQVSAEPGALLPQANLVVLAAPVGAIIQLLQDLPVLHPGAAVVLDLGSTKSAIVHTMQTLPERFDPVGGHPMCGKERGSLHNADAALYQGAVFALTALPRSSVSARSLAEQLVSVVGAHPLWMEAETHDRWVAATSHLPYLLANALAQATPPEAQPLVGPGLRSTTRLAATPRSMMLDVLATNRENLLASLQSFRQQLDRLEGCLVDGDWRALELYLSQGADRYAWLVESRRAE
ncbi:MAG: prephenate dehydrogenase [Anaerolineales bacterium]|nr:prephenate dehydrogenase [Anaerolineales bacterium]